MKKELMKYSKKQCRSLYDIKNDFDETYVSWESYQ